MRSSKLININTAPKIMAKFGFEHRFDDFKYILRWEHFSYSLNSV